MTTSNGIDFLPEQFEAPEYISETPRRLGPAIGIYLGRKIHSWVEIDNGIYDYEGIAAGPRPGLVDLSLLAYDEICITPGLRYVLRED